MILDHKEGGNYWSSWGQTIGSAPFPSTALVITTLWGRIICPIALSENAVNIMV